LSFSFNNGNDILFYKLYLHSFKFTLKSTKIDFNYFVSSSLFAVRLLLTALQLHYYCFALSLTLVKRALLSSDLPQHFRLQRQKSGGRIEL